MRRTLVFLLVLLAAPPAVRAQGSASGDVVARSNLQLRARPSSAARVVSSVPRGYPVLLRGCDGGWCEVSYMGVRGYAPAGQLTRSGPTPPGLLGPAAEPPPEAEPPEPDPREADPREAEAAAPAVPGPVRPLCKGALAEAEAAFAGGAFEDTIGLLARCAADGALSSLESAAAYRLLALAHVHEDQAPEAERAVRRLVGLEPGYEPDDRRDPPDYAALVRDVKHELGLLTAEDVRCDEDLGRARAHYLQERYAEVEAALGACLSAERLSEARLVRAHRLAALARMKRGDLDAAREAILALLQRVPDYRADPVQDLPALVSLVDGAREEHGRRPLRGW